MDNFLLSELLTYFDTQALGLLKDGVVLLRDNLSISLKILLVLTVNILGFSLLTGGLQNIGFGDVMSYLIKINIVCAMFLQIDDLVKWGYDFITVMPIEWSASVTKRWQQELPLVMRSMNTAQQIDQIYLHGVKQAIELASTWSPAKILLAIALFLASSALFVMTIVQLLGHKIIVLLLLIISPMFVALMLFKKTSGMTEAWLKQLVASTLTIFLVLMMVVLIIQLGLGVGENNQVSELTTESVIKSIIMMAVGAYFVAEVPGIARQISGGVSVESGLYGLSTFGGAMASARNSRQRWIAGGSKGWTERFGAGGEK